MISEEKNLLDILLDLKNNYGLVGLKSEFESEGATFAETMYLKNLLDTENIDLTIKLGGCAAIKDINESKIIGAKNLVAPMIESPFALCKFIQSIDNVFSIEEQETINLYINIETITGYRNLVQIMEKPEFNQIKGIVIGRADLCASLNLHKDQIDENEILDISKAICKSTKSKGKTITIGGKINYKSIDFFKKLSCFDRFETRKAIFDYKKAEKANLAEGIYKALDFEICWLKHKQKHFDNFNNADQQRIESLTKIKQNINNYRSISV